MVPPPKVYPPRIEIGRDETGKRWCVYVDGLPMGGNFTYKKEAKLVADWLFTCDWEFINTAPKREATSPF